MLSAGLVMGIMILPLISSMSEDALSAVPRSLREAAYAMGATKVETSLRSSCRGSFRHRRGGDCGHLTARSARP